MTSAIDGATTAAASYARLETGTQTFDQTRYSALPRILACHAPRRGFGAVVLEHAHEPLEAIDAVHEGMHGVIVPLRPGARFDAGPDANRLRSYAPARDHVAVLPAGIATHWRSRSAFRNLHFSISDALVRQVAEEDAIRRPIELRPTFELEATALHAVARQLATEIANPGPLSNALVDAYALALAVHLVRSQQSVSIARRSERLSLAPWRLRRAQDFIEAHLTEDLGLHEIAAEAGLSPFHFARSFRRATGISPHRYLVLRRIERAKQLLEATDLPIAQVALECGYAAQPAFTRAFARTTGTTPARHRSENGGRLRA